MSEISGVVGAPMDLSKRKIAIGFPSPDLIDVAFHNALIKMITQTSQFVPLGLTNVVGSRIAMNRNTIVKQARMLGVTDILWIDSDTVFPIDALMRLLMRDKDIVCATTCKRKGNDRSPVARVEDLASIEPNQILVKMKEIGFAFMLTKMSVFDKLEELGYAPESDSGDRPYFAEPPRWMMEALGDAIPGPDSLVGEDHYWCYLVRKAGFDIWCDMELTMEIGHVGNIVYYVENAVSPEAKVDEVL